MQYSDGTISISISSGENGSNIVTGVGTLFEENVAPGDLIFINGDIVPFTIASVDSDTQLTLSADYTSEKVDVDYQIVTDFTLYYDLGKINRGDLNSAEIFNHNMDLIDAALKDFEDRIAALEP
jgi:hypothetical protein